MYPAGAHKCEDKGSIKALSVPSSPIDGLRQMSVPDCNVQWRFSVALCLPRYWKQLGLYSFIQKPRTVEFTWCLKEHSWLFCLLPTDSRNEPWKAVSEKRSYKLLDVCYAPKICIPVLVSKHPELENETTFYSLWVKGETGKEEEKTTHKWEDSTTTTPVEKNPKDTNKKPSQKPTKNLSLRFLKEFKGIQTA